MFDGDHFENVEKFGRMFESPTRGSDTERRREHKGEVRENRGRKERERRKLEH